ncbi:MAG: amidase [SAR324 cluster bacterium]|nr:amidase [SAR324 cluster bacterium]
MAIFKEYSNYDATGLAELIKKKEVSPAELVETAMYFIEKINPRVNAVVTKIFEQAQKQAKQELPDGPFRGVPFLIKDLSSSYAGVRMTKGCKALKHYVPTYDSEIMTRYKKTGVIILGKTNTPEFGIMGVTEPELFGPSRNPWDTLHTPGGSSGGSAAAVASGMVPMASAGDGGGSIRIPASCCGVFGLKPTRGRVPTGPDLGENWQGAAVEHVISRSVRDSAAMLDAIQGADAGAPYVIAPPLRPYLEEIKRRAGRWKIAYTTQSPLKTPVNSDCVKAVLETVDLLKTMGFEVEEAAPEYDGELLAKVYLMMNCAEVAVEVDSLETVLGRKPVPEDVEPSTWTLAMLGKAYSAAEFVQAKHHWNTFARVMGRFHQKYDFLLTPTTATPPVKIGELMPGMIESMGIKLANRLGSGQILRKAGVVEQVAHRNFSKLPFTQLANLTGQPAMSVPMHWTLNKLPVGVQFIAKFGEDAKLLRLAAKLEAAQPWFNKHPSVFAS